MSGYRGAGPPALNALFYDLLRNSYFIDREHSCKNLVRRVGLRKFGGICTFRAKTGKAVRTGVACHIKTREIGDSGTMASPKLGVILPCLQAIVPPLTAERHKGQAGRFAVVGGCMEYTGAPYFAGISALKMGADLCHVFCSVDAGTAIKSYSPELIVHPVLHDRGLTRACDETKLLDLRNSVMLDIRKWMPNLSGIVIGPGLGRDPHHLAVAAEIIKEARFRELPMVIDGDGLFLVTNEPHLVQGNPRVVLTPNYNEYKRLAAKLLGNNFEVGLKPEDLPGQVQLLASRMGVTIIKKGPSDIISDGITVVESDFFGSPRRCGGQGDVLSGSTAVFMAWARQYLEMEAGSAGAGLVPTSISANPCLLGGFAASILVRRAAAVAFAKQRRGTLTTDLIEALPPSMDELFPLVELADCVAIKHD